MAADKDCLSDPGQGIEPLMSDKVAGLVMNLSAGLSDVKWDGDSVEAGSGLALNLL